MASRKDLPASPYTLEGVTRACKILHVFEDDRKAFSLTEVAEGAGLERTVCFRLLRTLEEQGHRICFSDQRFVLQRARPGIAVGCRIETD